MAPRANKVRENSVGHAGGIVPTWSTIAGTGWESVGWDENPDLRFPYSVAVYNRMRKTDSQVLSVLRAITLPIRAAKWTLNNDGVDPEIAAFVADEINLDGGEHKVGGINWPEHLREALLALPLGFAPFHLSYEIGPSRTEGAPPLVAHLTQPGLRPPMTISEVRATPRGELDGIAQMPAGFDTVYGTIRVGNAGAVSMLDTWIPARELLFYCFEREGADWTGSSVLRACYKDHFIKDMMVKKSAQAVDRQGLGLPVFKYSDPEYREDALEIASEARAGGTAGVAYDMTKGELEILGVTGGVVDPTPRIKYHDEQIAQSMLAMVLTLGHDAGARSLGDTFAEIFATGQNSIVDWIGVTFTAGAIRQMVDLNFGEGRKIPKLVCEEITAGQAVTADAVAQLIDSGAVVADKALRDDLRRRFGLAPEDGSKPLQSVPTDKPAPGEVDETPADDAATMAARLSSVVDRLVALAAAQG